jgi:ABC-2 type transport system permease protein
MKMIFRVAGNELRNLFYSPVAWFLTVAFMVQCAVFYAVPVSMFARIQDVLTKSNPKFKGFGIAITPGLFLDSNGIFTNVLQNLYLFVPLLTMGLISREINNGSIKLLYSSPVKLREIVMGKYLAIMIYNLLLVLIVGIFIVSGILHIKSPDYGMLLSAALGFYLLVCAYAAIGMFMSCLSTYQIVSAISTFIIIFILSRIGGLWQKYDVIRDLTYFLSLSGRTGKMLKGLLTTKDVIYFILIVYMFIGFTVVKLKAERETKPWFLKGLRYVGVFLIVLALGYVSSRPAFTGYWDTTTNNVNTLHPRTQQLLKQLGKEPLEITLYTNLLGDGVGNGLPESRNAYLSGLWEPYLRFKPDIKFNYVYYYDVNDNDSTVYRQFPGKNLQQILPEIAKVLEVNPADFISPAEIRKRINLEPESYRLVMELKYKGRKTFLRTFNDNVFWPDETQVGPALMKVMGEKMGKNIFLTGDLERDIYKRGEREFAAHTTAKDNRGALINVGFEDDTLSLDRADIPADANTVVLADPKTILTPLSLAKLKQHISNGGNMFILGKPGKQHILNPVLEQLGVKLADGTLVQISKQEMPHMVSPFVTLAAAGLAEESPLIKLKENWGEEDSLFFVQPGVTEVAVADSTAFKVTPLLQTIPDRVWLKAGVLVTDSVPPVYTPAEGDSKKAMYTTGLALTRTINHKEQRIIVLGDADMMSNLRSGGSFLGRSFYSWLTENKFPRYVPRPDPLDVMMTISQEGANIMKIVYIWILPGIVLLTGTILLIRRKRK